MTEGQPDSRTAALDQDVFVAEFRRWRDVRGLSRSALQAWCGEDRAETMRWTVQHDRDAFKEVWLLFANDSGRFPLYPGDSTWIEYAYTVGDTAVPRSS